MSDTPPRWRRYLRLARPDPGADIDDELRFHLAMRAERNRALGMTPEDADREARARFGDASRVRAQLHEHDTRRLAAEGRREYLADIAHDLRFGLRSLRRAPGFAVAATLTLALGIGGNAAIFSVVNAVLLQPLPYVNAHELIAIGMGSAGEFQALQERLRGFSGVAMFASQTHPVDDGTESVRLEGTAITTNLLPLLGVRPMLGRGFTDDDAVPGGGVLLISHGFWQRKFGGARDVLGRRLQVEGVPQTIVGVMPPTFQFPDRNTQYWQPWVFNPANVGYHWAVGGRSFIGRLAPGVTPAQAQEELQRVWPSLRRLNPLWDPGETYGTNAAAKPLQRAVVGESGRVLWLLFGSVLLVLLIGCVNVANLLLARATARERELSVRAALGGGRGRLVRQLFTESLLLAVTGAALGVTLAFVAVRWLVTAMPAEMPRAHEITVNGWVLAFTAAVAVLTALLFGVVPALRATRRIAPAGTLNAGRRGTRGVEHRRVTGWLVGAEVALAVSLAIGSLLLVRSFFALRDVDTGFRPAQLIAARITPPAFDYRDAARVNALYDAVLEQTRARPGVTAAAAVDKLPMAQSIWGIAVRVRGQFEDGTRLLPELASYQSVTPGYFATMGIALLQGRDFTDADREGQEPVAIVTESVARQFWPGGHAVGRHIGYPYPSPWLTVVGVVADTKQDSLTDTARTTLYTPMRQRSRMSGSEMWLVARTTGDAGVLAGSLREMVHRVDRTVAVSDVRTMRAVISRSMQRARFVTALVGAFALAALVLGAIGIYGVMSYLVGQCRQEMGIRLALGASPREVMRLVVGRGALMAAGGAAVGMAAAYAGAGVLESLLFGVSSRDPLTFAAVALLFIAVAVGASYVPARRATRVNPVQALRAD